MKKLDLEKMPTGYRFNPTDEEIIMYLRLKAKGEDLTNFSEINLYGEPPWIIFQNSNKPSLSKSVLGNGVTEHDQNIRFFYTKLKNKYESGQKISRSFGKNEEFCWLGVDKGKKIYENGANGLQVIGMKKMFSFILKSVAENAGKKKQRIKSCSSSSSSRNDFHEDFDHGNWIMHEYSLVDSPSSAVDNPSNYVLCKIKIKDLSKLAAMKTGNAAGAPVPSSAIVHYQQQQQQQDNLPGAADLALVPVNGTTTTAASMEVPSSAIAQYHQQQQDNATATSTSMALPSRANIVQYQQQQQDNLLGAALVPVGTYQEQGNLYGNQLFEKGETSAPVPVLGPFSSIVHYQQQQQQQQYKQGQDVVNGTTTSAPMPVPLPSSGIVHYQQQQENWHNTSDLTLVPVGMEFQRNYQKQLNIFDELFTKDEQKEVRVLLYGTEEVQPVAATMEGAASMQVEMNMEVSMPSLPVLPSTNSMVDNQLVQYYPMNVQAEENRMVMNNGGGSDYAELEVDSLDNAFHSFGQNNYMSAVTDEVVDENGEYNFFWEEVWMSPNCFNHHFRPTGF